MHTRNLKLTKPISIYKIGNLQYSFSASKIKNLIIFNSNKNIITALLKIKDPSLLKKDHVIATNNFLLKLRNTDLRYIDKTISKFPSWWVTRISPSTIYVVPKKQVTNQVHIWIIEIWCSRLIRVLIKVPISLMPRITVILNGDSFGLSSRVKVDNTKVARRTWS